jgi:diguanylate cyclase (GGDEF)-like protein/PAS domain S-box-containing protein
MPSPRFTLHLLSCFVLVILASIFVELFKQNRGTEDLIWTANGLLLAYLLMTTRRHMPAYLFTGFIAIFFSCLLIHQPWRMSLLYAVMNTTEVLIAALLLHRQDKELPRFTEPSYLFRFIGIAVLAAPITAELIFAFINWSWTHDSLLSDFLNWFGADSLGIAVITPTCVAISQADFQDPQWWRQCRFYLTLTAIVTTIAFCQDAIPFVLLIYPLIVVVALRVDLSCAALSMLLSTVTAICFTVHGMGPFAPSGPNDVVEAGVFLQLHVAVGIFILYSVSVVQNRQKNTERQLQEAVTFYKLVTENSRDLIILTDLYGHRFYVSGGRGNMGGWTREELIRQNGLSLVHPDDLAQVTALMKKLYSSMGSAILEFRARQRDGSYAWVETNLCIVRDPASNVPTGILDIVRDISERKQAEEKLQEAYNTVEAQAVTDGLTGLANRRQFDQYLASEWQRAMRNGLPVSLLMIDADHFKRYNDTYGHVNGDQCLRQIAAVCQDAVTRPGDLVARFGGEEFAIILPNTDNKGVLQVARQVCQALRDRKLPHRANLPGVVTISVGCATAIPKAEMHASQLIEIADQALYQAKHKGRNQVCNGNLRGKNKKYTEFFT